VARRPSRLVNTQESRRHGRCRSRFASSRVLRGNGRAASASARGPWPCSLGSSRWADLTNARGEPAECRSKLPRFDPATGGARIGLCGIAPGRQRQSRQLAAASGIVGYGERSARRAAETSASVVLRCACGHVLPVLQKGTLIRGSRCADRPRAKHGLVLPLDAQAETSSAAQQAVAPDTGLLRGPALKRLVRSGHLRVRR
jgi:hypothetical protein